LLLLLPDSCFRLVGTPALLLNSLPLPLLQHLLLAL
jgi:hypothetical protein